MKINILDIEDRQVKFVLVSDDGAESNILSMNADYFDDVKTMALLNLSFEEAKTSDKLGIMPKNRLKRLSEQFTGFTPR